MIRNRILVKTFAVFFLIEMFGTVVAPAVSWALTSGPTAPEATSFEPVDTTDIVNTLTGDLVYNLPIIEVPGPCGGYPLSLSYHAGILPNEEASIVGLGFSLNPGSIIRNVNGYPDDYNNINNVDRVYWSGGHRESYDVGIGIGIANSPLSANFGLSFSQDTYQGFGVGVSGGFGLKENGVELGVQMGRGPYGGDYVNAGVTLANEVGNVGVNLNSNTGLSAGGSLGKLTSIGATISSEGITASYSVGSGNYGVYNSKAGSISTESNSFGVQIPIYCVYLSLGYNYTRYWSDETVTVKTNGALYYPKSLQTDFDNSAYDYYSLLSPGSNSVENTDPDTKLGGSFPGYDDYYVNAQGISGSIKPYQYKGLVFRQNKKKNDNSYTTKQYAYKDTEYKNEPLEFRFVNDFSNKYLNSGGKITYDNAATEPLSFDFENVQQTGETGNDGIDNNHLAGSKHIEWYTNQEIISSLGTKEEGFVNCQIEGFDRLAYPGEQIGGFKITNESGITYHYALPVYSMNEIMYSENIYKDNEGKRFNKLSRPAKYAYTWYLTSVTGPDYVDRNENGIADNEDWGYWVDIAYTKYADDYHWRNPSEGFHQDIDSDFKNYSSGDKEVYYLSTIRTATNIAIFEKSERYDSREVTSSINGGFEITDGSTSRSSLRLDQITLYRSEDFDLDRLSKENALRKIKFNYDYSLCPQTTNSFRIDKPSEKLGKLTLKSIQFCGVNDDVGLVPPINFTYETEGNNLGHLGVQATDFDGRGAAKVGKNNNISSGHLIKFTQNGIAKYAVVGDEDQYYLYLWPLGNSVIDGNPIKDVYYTKNPPYQYDAYDIWNNYQPLAHNDNFSGNDPVDDYYDQNAVRSTEPRYVDVWSLRKISNSLGNEIEINYESDDYGEVALFGNYHAEILSIFNKSDNSIHLILNGGPGTFKTGDYIRILLYIESGNPCEDFFPILIDKNYKILNIDEDGTLVVPIVNHILFSSDCDLVDASRDERHFKSFYGGHVISKTNKKFSYGGGIRVKNIKLNSDDGIRETSYTYTDTENYSSGVTSYEPYSFVNTIYKQLVRTKRWHNTGSSQISDYTTKEYNKLLYEDFSYLMPIAKELPAPGVMYRRVKVSERVIDKNNKETIVPNSTVYEFDVFDDVLVKTTEMPTTHFPNDGSYHNYDNNRYYYAVAKEVVLQDFSSRLGNLKRISTYSNGTLIGETQNHYLHNESGDYVTLLDQFNNQGVIHETFMEGKFRKDDNGIDVLSGLIARRQRFPSILIKQTSTNYLTNVTTTSEKLAFDFYSGGVTKTSTTDSYGNKYLSVSVPAYKNYSGMGLKIGEHKNTNKHMLSQMSEEYTYLVDAANQPMGVVSASIQTWSDQTPVLGLTSPQSNIWRRSAIYQWNGQMDLVNGVYPYSDFQLHPFSNWSSADETDNDYWEKVNKIRLYDVFSHELEATDINNNYASSRMNNEQKLVIANASNARYNEMAYSGAEYYLGNDALEGGVSRGNGFAAKAHAHTGTYSLMVGTGNVGFNYSLYSTTADFGKKYRASVWVYLPGDAETQADLTRLELYYSINGIEQKAIHPVFQKNKSKSWYLLNLDVNPGSASGTLVISVRNKTQRSAYFDDFRVHPLNGALNAYVYDPLTKQVNYILDGNNFYTKFDYDQMGRLIRTSKEQLNFDFGDGKESFKADAIVKEFKYNFGKGN